MTVFLWGWGMAGFHRLKEKLFTLAEGATHVDKFGNFRKTAFTLAEVLITLGIIGVVVAMTLPTLIQNHKKKEIVTRLEKTYSIMNQAINLSKANDTWGVIPLDKRGDNEALADWLETALLPYLKVVKYCRLSNEGACAEPNGLNEKYLSFIMSDGVKMYCDNNIRIHIYVDINGNKKPNKPGEDIFYFSIASDEDYLRWRKQYDNIVGYFHPMEYAYATDDEDQFGDHFVTTREDMIKYCSSKYTTKTFATTCALLIMHDGWQISGDYPIKL